MLISRLALSLFWFPGVCPLRLEYFVFLKRITGSFSCFRCLIFKVLCALFFLSSAWLFYHISLCLSRTFFRSFSEVFSEKSFSILSHLSMFVKNFFALTFAELFYLTTTNQGLSRFFSAPLSAWLFYHVFSLLSTPFFAFFRLFPRFVRSVGFLHNLSTSVYTRRTTLLFVHPP